MKFIRLKYLKIIIPVVLIIGVTVGLLVWANAPNQGTISNASTVKSPTAYFDKTLDGTYMKFKYSSKYVAKDAGPGNGDLERYTLSANTRYDRRILASVADLPDGRLESNGAYIFRQKNSSLYSHRMVKVGSDIIDVAVNKDGTEQTAMIPRDKKAAIISFVSSNTSDDLTTEIDSLLNSFQWKK